MKSIEHQIVESLSGNDEKIYKYLPYLLQDLSSLGTNIKILHQLIDKKSDKFSEAGNVLELCCGKGASIISIVKKYRWSGNGIDLFPHFINEARSAALNENVSSVEFEVMNIKDAVNTFSDYDLILYGADTRCLGDEITTLKKISRCLSKNGFIIYETSFEKKMPFEKRLQKNGFKILDRIEHDISEVEGLDKFITDKIKARANELTEKYPGEKDLFDKYVSLQEEECYELENNLRSVTYLLALK